MCANRESYDAPPGASALSERDRVLASVAERCMRDLPLSAVTAYLRDPDEQALRAAVIAVSPLGLASPERLPLNDDVYTSVRAYRTGQQYSTDSLKVVTKHPDLATLSPFPYAVTSSPLWGRRRYGALAVFWPHLQRRPTSLELEYLRNTTRNVSVALDLLAEAGASMAPPRETAVISGPLEEEGGEISSGGTGVAGVDRHTAPLLFHLQKIAMSISSVISTKEAVTLVISRLFSGFGADAVAISLIEAERLRVVGANRCSRGFLRELDGSSLGSGSAEAVAIATRQVVMRPAGDPRTADRVAAGGAAAHAWVVLPLLAGGRTIGTCSVAFAASQDDLADKRMVLSTLATLLGEALARSQSFDAQRALTKKQQEALLPRTIQQVDGILVTGRYTPAENAVELGGDWYDFIRLPNGDVAAVIGDVQGHNPDAAVVMGQLRSAVRAYATEGHEPSAVLDRSNHLLLDLRTDLLATCCCLWLDIATGTARIATAGHPPPLIGGEDGISVPSGVEPGPPLGVVDDPTYQDSIVTLDPGTLVALYTDGLTGREGDLAPGVLAGALGRVGAELEGLGDELMRHARTTGGGVDDAALLLLRYEGAPHDASRRVSRLEIHRQDLPGVRRARRFLEERLHDWHLEYLADTAELLTSEVVTNALIHGDSDVDIHLRMYPDRLRLEVRDSEPRRAIPIMPSDEDSVADPAEGGRGLPIVSSLASAWGNSPSGRGKTVWFELNTAGDG